MTWVDLLPYRTTLTAWGKQCHICDKQIYLGGSNRGLKNPEISQRAPGVHKICTGGGGGHRTASVKVTKTGAWTGTPPSPARHHVAPAGIRHQVWWASPACPAYSNPEVLMRLPSKTAHLLPPRPWVPPANLQGEWKGGWEHHLLQGTGRGGRRKPGPGSKGDHGASCP